MSQVQIMKSQSDIRIDNAVELLNCINKQYIIKAIRLLNQKPMTYVELMVGLGFNKKDKSGQFAYYLRKIKQSGFIMLDAKRSWYHLTFKGKKVFDLLVSVEMLANLSMKDMAGLTAPFTLTLDRERPWIEQIIKTEIQKAVRELKR